VSFAAPYFLLGALFALAIGALLLFGSVALRRAVKRFGEPERVYSLQTADASKRRAYKGLLLVVAVALAFVAAARPQYGKGTRLIPATNIDVIIVLDYSKSMFAQDVEPSRIFRAKVEVSRLVKDLPGARFGAVAFAGEPMGLPLSADGAAIAQFFRQLDPNDMPVGGTAIARALDHARNLLNRDPKSADHKRIILLVTDGEDLEGDPVAVARSIASEGTVINVVQIGGRTPERIPEISAEGKIVGYRTDRAGRPLMTSLSVEGEKQLAEIAEVTGGAIVRAEHGSTGIEKVAAEIRSQMKGELSERVETVYADIYFYPLGLAIALLVIEALIGETARRVFLPRRAPVRPGSAMPAPLVLAGMPSYMSSPSSSEPPQQGPGRSPKLERLSRKKEEGPGRSPLLDRLSRKKGEEPAIRGGEERELSIEPVSEKKKEGKRGRS
jgi:Ca-activated chloride channel homolog